MHLWLLLSTLVHPGLTLSAFVYPLSTQQQLFAKVAKVCSSSALTAGVGVTRLCVRGHLGPSLSKSMPPHEPSPAIVMYTIPLPCGTYVYSLKLW